MKPTGEPVAELASRWVLKAEEDLTLARHGLRLGNDCPFGLICFLAQQCAEKYLKAMLTWRGIPFGKIHDLAELANLRPTDVEVGVKRRNLDTLTVYAVQPRYPYAGPPLTRRNAAAAIRLAIQIRDSLREYLPVPANRRKVNRQASV